MQLQEKTNCGKQTGAHQNSQQDANTPNLAREAVPSEGKKSESSELNEKRAHGSSRADSVVNPLSQQTSHAQLESLPPPYKRQKINEDNSD